MSIADSPAVDRLPTYLHLPETDGKPADSSFDHPQSALLSDVLLPVLSRLHPDENYFVGADTGIYWALTKPDPLEGCKSPDWYYVPNVSRLRDGILRRSYVMWNEGVRPLIVLEYVSDDGVNERDTTPHSGKFWVYERGICATYYAIWDVPRSTLEVYELVRGNYQLLNPDAHGRYWIPEMEVSFGIWHGEYHGYDTEWLRAWDHSGELLPTATESGDAARALAASEWQRAEVEKQRAEKLGAKLRELGIDPDSV